MTVVAQVCPLCGVRPAFGRPGSGKSGYPDARGARYWIVCGCGGRAWHPRKRDLKPYGEPTYSDLGAAWNASVERSAKLRRPVTSV